MSERPMAERHEWGDGFFVERVGDGGSFIRGGASSVSEIERELLRVVAERDKAQLLVAQGVADKVALFDLAEQRGVERDAAEEQRNALGKAFKAAAEALAEIPSDPGGEIGLVIEDIDKALRDAGLLSKEK